MAASLHSTTWHHHAMHPRPDPVDAITAALSALPASPLCVGFSGGLDSSVLLHALAQSPIARAHGLRAWHVHHGLHPQADDWAAHCATVSVASGVALQVSRVEVRRDGEGLEAAARHARHAAFAAGLGVGEVMVFAHHRDDQAETFLLRALRASGPDGLGAMPTWRPLGQGSLWRPLLAVPRTALEAYAERHRLHWIDDPSNQDLSFDRNFLRQRVIPLLRERWPHARDALATSADLCGQAGDLLREGDREALAAVVGVDPHVLSLPALRAVPVARRARVLRHWIATLGLPPLPAEGIVQIEQCLLDAEPDAAGCFAWRDAAIQAWRDSLHAATVRPALPLEWQAEWDGRAPLPIPGGGSLALHGCAGFEQPMRVHARRGGERITLPGRRHAHALKHVLQDLGIPPWERARMPLLGTDAGELLAAADLAYAARFDAWLRQRGARLHWSG